MNKLDCVSKLLLMTKRDNYVRLEPTKNELLFICDSLVQKLQTWFLIAIAIGNFKGTKTIHLDNQNIWQSILIIGISEMIQ